MVAAQVTGVVLAGGRATRMGGVDKGLQLLDGIPLALHALRRLQPQVGCLLLNANRHLDRYRSFGVEVRPDAVPGHPGPLAGFITALQHCTTPWLATVPCDAPFFPTDLVEKLAAAAAADQADIAMASAPDLQHNGPAVWRDQPVFCLLRNDLRPSLEAFVTGGGRKVGAWAAQQKTVSVRFDDARAFSNANTPAELQALQACAVDTP